MRRRASRKDFSHQTPKATYRHIGIFLPGEHINKIAYGLIAEIEVGHIIQHAVCQRLILYSWVNVREVTYGYTQSVIEDDFSTVI
jgi:hypothetical protein